MNTKFQVGDVVLHTPTNRLFEIVEPPGPIPNLSSWVQELGCGADSKLPLFNSNLKLVEPLTVALHLINHGKQNT